MARRRTKEESGIGDAREQVKDLKGGSYYINAAAGTGKTQSLAERVVNALSDGKCEPSQMLCLTFTNSAATEMRERISALIENSGTDGGKDLKKKAEMVSIGTIHKYCYQRLPERRYRTIIDSRELPRIIKEIAKEPGKYSNKPELVRKYAAILRQKKEGHPKDVLLQYFGPLSKNKRDELRKLAEGYSVYKGRNNRIDFDDLLISTYSALRKPKAKESAKSSYSWIQVDEAQDLTPLQHGIIRQLVRDEDSTVCYFGDFNQAIYSFLGTRDNPLKRLPDFGKEGHMFSFQKNYRSSKSLVNMFNRYLVECLKVDDDAIRKALKPLPRTKPKHFDLKCFGSDIEERNEVAKMVKAVLEYNEGSRSKDGGGKKYKYGYDKSRRRTAAILVRTGEQADAFSRALLFNGVEHMKLSGTDALKRDAIKALVAHFGVINDEFSRWDWSVILSHLHCGSGVQRSGEIFDGMLKHGILPTDFLNYEDSTYLSEFVKAASESFVVYNKQKALKIGPDGVEEFPERLGKEFLISDSFVRFAGTSALVYTEREQNSNDHWDGRKLKMLLGVKRPGNNPEDYKDLLEKARVRVEEQDAYMSHLGAQYVRKKLRGAYLDIYEHSRALYESDPKTNKDSGRHLADEFRWVYRRMLRRHIIHNFNPALMDKKKEEYNYNLENRVSDNAFENKWTNYCNGEEALVKSKTEYYFKYLEQEVFGDDDSKSVRALLGEKLMEIRSIQESDLCQMPFVKESVFVMTVHQAKGHEFSDVFITGASDGNYPFHKSRTSGAVEEDKRLFYVAMTRSSSRLCVTYSSRSHVVHNQYTRKQTIKQTPFLECILDYFVPKDKKR